MQSEQSDKSQIRLELNLNHLPLPNLLGPKKNSQTLSEVPSDIIIKSHIKYGSKSSAFKASLIEYSKKTSIHGLSYIFEIHRPLYEKLYWIILSLISFYLAIIYMWATYIKWLDSPIILGFDETLVPIHKIPFPTVTICPETKRDVNIFDLPQASEIIMAEIQKYKTFKNRAGFSTELLQLFAASLQVCDKKVIQRFASYLPPEIQINVTQTMINMMVDPILSLPMCKWNGRFYNCNDILKTVVTEEGVCYQFNGLKNRDLYNNPEFISYSNDRIINFNNYIDKNLTKFNNITGNWSLDTGYVGQGFNAYPQRSVLSSARNGFYVLLDDFDENFDYTCRQFKKGYKIFLNSPESVPLTTGNYILVPHLHEVKITIIPQYITSKRNIVSFGPEKRQCYFNYERTLRFFKFYTQNNCQTECLTNYTIAKCGCAKFWMPKPLDIPVCSLLDVNCYTNAAKELDVILAEQIKEKSLDPNTKIMCDCIPACNSLEYNFEINRAYMDAEATAIATRQPYELGGTYTSRFTVYFKETQFTAIKRTVLYGMTQLIANCGGIFGLFMGVSALSVFELIYFVTLRLLNNLRKRRAIKEKLVQLEMEMIK